MANKVHLRVHLENRVVITTVKAGFANGPLEARSVHFRNQVNKGFGVAFAASNLSFTFPAVEDKEGCFGDESYAEVIWSRSHLGSKAIWRGQDGRVHSVRLLWLRTFH